MGAAMFGAFAEQIAVPADSLQSGRSDAVDLATAAAFGVAHQTAYPPSAAWPSPARRLGRGARRRRWRRAGRRRAGPTCSEPGCWPRRLAPRSWPCASPGRRGDRELRPRTSRCGSRRSPVGGADVVVDPVGGPTPRRPCARPRWAGRFVTVGFASGRSRSIPLNLVLLKGLADDRVHHGGVRPHRAEDARRDLAELGELARTGRAAPYISVTYPLDQVGQALADLADRRAMGKVLVDPTR